MLCVSRGETSFLSDQIFISPPEYRISGSTSGAGARFPFFFHFLSRFFEILFYPVIQFTTLLTSEYKIGIKIFRKRTGINVKRDFFSHLIPIAIRNADNKIAATRLQHAAWLGNTSALTTINNNNIFVRESPVSRDYQITDTGLPGVIYNGVPDWLYQGRHIYMCICRI